MPLKPNELSPEGQHKWKETHRFFDNFWPQFPPASVDVRSLYFFQPWQGRLFSVTAGITSNRKSHYKLEDRLPIFEARGSLRFISYIKICNWIGLFTAQTLQNM